VAKLPTTEGVAVAWLSTLALPGVATTLPKLDAWPVMGGTVRGFVQVDGVVGSRVLGGVRCPIVSVSTWAAVPGSDNPQWGAANDLAETVWTSVEPNARFLSSVRVQQSAKHDAALVHSVYGVAEPRRVPDPDASRAHFVLEAALMWTKAGA